MAKTINLGKVGLTFEGDYDSSKNYASRTCVFYDHVSWASKKDVPAGIAPGSNDEYWQKVSERGAQGIQGERGPQGNSAFDGTGIELVNNLTQGGEASALSAEQGKILKEELTELSAKLVDVTTTETELTLDVGSYITAGNVGATIKPTNDNDPSWRCLIAPCKEGDKFIITGTGGGTPRLWCFLDSQSRIVSISPAASQLTNGEITAPTSAASLVVNMNAVYPYALTHISTETTDILHNLDERVSRLEPAEVTETDYGLPVFAPYKCQQTDFSFGTKDTTSSEIYAQYDTLVASGFLTKENIGNASDGSAMYCYKRVTPRPVAFAEAKKVQIIIIAGQHGFEKSNIFGLFLFLRDIAEHYADSDVLQYFYEWVDFIIIPCANNSGIDKSIYLNGNGVNLNRNWPVIGWKKSDAAAGTSQYGGESAGSEPEVQNIIRVLADYPNATFLMDSHTNGGGNITENKFANWIDIPWDEKDIHRKNLLNVSRFHLCNISNILWQKYADVDHQDDSPIFGYITQGSVSNTAGYLDVWAAQQGMLSLTFEGFNAFTGGGIATPSVKSANAELIGNYLIAFLAHYSKL